MPSKKRQFGDKGEDLACQYLKQKGYQILARNWRIKSGEVDIVAVKTKGLFGQKLEVIVFVEVKSGKENNLAYAPELRVNFFKQQKLIRTAQKYLKYKKISPEIPWRIDVLAVNFNEQNGLYDIRHYENAVWAKH